MPTEDAILMGLIPGIKKTRFIVLKEAVFSIHLLDCGKLTYSSVVQSANYNGRRQVRYPLTSISINEGTYH